MRASAWTLLLFCGCSLRYDPCFAPATEVSALQLLSISPDPPQARIAPDGSVEPTALHVLFADPLRSGEHIDVKGSLCPLDGNSCESFNIAGEPDGQMSFLVQPSPALMRAAVTGDPLHGFEAVRLKMSFDAKSPTAVESGEKLLVFSRPGEVPNGPFQIVGVEVRRLVHEHRERFDRVYPPDEETLAPGATLQVDVGDPVWLRPILSPGAAEEYDTTDLTGKAVHLREQISYTFHSTGHVNFGYDSAGEPEPGQTSDLPGLTYLSYLRFRGGAGSVWIVARDSRGAQSWLALNLTATDARTCADPRFGVPCELLEVSCQDTAPR